MASSVPVKPESQQNQVYMKHKMLLELQQQKLRLKLMQTQAQLKDQQKQLEKQTPNHTSDATSAELSVSTSSLILSYIIDPVPLPTKGQGSAIANNIKCKQNVWSAVTWSTVCM